jgi:RNA-directed DNA polymerase
MYDPNTCNPIEVPINIDPRVPTIIDDMNLAMTLGISARTLWYLILTRDTSHYTVHRIPKKKGGHRTLHAPSAILALVQNRVLTQILDPLQEGLGPHVTAYRKQHSIPKAVTRHIFKCPICDISPIKTALPAHNCPKAGTFIKLDIRHFFPSIHATHVRNYFKKVVGYNHQVASLLADLMIVRTKPNPAFLPGNNNVKFLSEVPQGAPTSGAICNLVADQLLDIPLIKQLDTYAAQWGAHYVYSRYADDLALTWDIKLTKPQIAELLSAAQKVTFEAGLRINHEKTRVLHGPHCKKKLLGIVITEHPNYDRNQYRKLRALLHNCKVEGFEKQLSVTQHPNVKKLHQWLKGTLNWINTINPVKGQQLLLQYDQLVGKSNV